MKRLQRPVAVALVATLLLTACESPIPFAGETRADVNMRDEIARHILIPLQMVYRCPSVDRIETQVLAVHPPVTDAMTELARSERVFEHWTVSMCGQRFAFQVRHSPSPNGGADFSVRQIAVK